MLEAVHGPRRDTTLVQELGADQLRKPSVQQRGLQVRYSREQFVRELSTQHRGELRHLLEGTQSIEPRHE